MGAIAFVRHGQSEWNLANRFTGWADVNLTDKGEAEARRAGELLKDCGVGFEHCYASLQTRAIRTLWLALEIMDQVYLPVDKHWRLNERHYGALTGLNKAETAERHGADQVKIWRRSYDVPPPAMDAGDPDNPANDPRYAAVPRDQLPASEALSHTLERVMPYWTETLEPRVIAGGNLIVAAHGNSIRALIKHLFAVPEDKIVGVEVPTGNPLLLSFFAGSARVQAARYLDESRAADLPALA